MELIRGFLQTSRYHVIHFAREIHPSHCRHQPTQNFFYLKVHSCCIDFLIALHFLSCFLPNFQWSILFPLKFWSSKILFHDDPVLSTSLNIITHSIVGFAFWVSFKYLDGLNFWTQKSAVNCWIWCEKNRTKRNDINALVYSLLAIQNMKKLIQWLRTSKEFAIWRNNCIQKWRKWRFKIVIHITWNL